MTGFDGLACTTPDALGEQDVVASEKPLQLALHVVQEVVEVGPEGRIVRHFDVLLVLVEVRRATPRVEVAGAGLEPATSWL
jgi:hypothetical protein